MSNIPDFGTGILPGILSDEKSSRKKEKKKRKLAEKDLAVFRKRESVRAKSLSLDDSITTLLAGRPGSTATGTLLGN